MSALYAAAKRGACASIASLIRMGTSVHAEPSPGKTALIAAIENDQVKALETPLARRRQRWITHVGGETALIRRWFTTIHVRSDVDRRW